jgi:hypothetical protein
MPYLLGLGWRGLDYQHHWYHTPHQWPGRRTQRIIVNGSGLWQTDERNIT